MLRKLGKWNKLQIFHRYFLRESRNSRIFHVLFNITCNWRWLIKRSVHTSDEYTRSIKFLRRKMSRSYAMSFFCLELHFPGNNFKRHSIKQPDVTNHAVKPGSHACNVLRRTRRYLKLSKRIVLSKYFLYRKLHLWWRNSTFRHLQIRCTKRIAQLDEAYLLFRWMIRRKNWMLWQSLFSYALATFQLQTVSETFST